MGWSLTKPRVRRQSPHGPLLEMLTGCTLRTRVAAHKMNLCVTQVAIDFLSVCAYVARASEG
jgi:hypothetical protein